MPSLSAITGILAVKVSGVSSEEYFSREASSSAMREFMKSSSVEKRAMNSLKGSGPALCLSLPFIFSIDAATSAL